MKMKYLNVLLALFLAVLFDITNAKKATFATSFRLQGGNSKNVGGSTNPTQPVTASSQSFSSFEEYFNRPGPWDDKNLRPIFAANKAWVRRIEREQPNYFAELRKGHAPKILWIGCSDARVPANEIIGEPPGSVFVHRNIANMVVNTDFNCMSVIQYAVDILKVKHIIVCGHYDCGGIRAALELKDYKSPLENWLRNIRDTCRLHKNELLNITDIVARNRRLVELNVIEQCVNVFKTAVVQRRRVESYLESIKEGSTTPFVLPRIHALVYEPGTGELRRLHVDFTSYMRELRDVYDLYRVDQYVDSPVNLLAPHPFPENASENANGIVEHDIDHGSETKKSS